MKSKVIVFDLGGVLIDWNPRYLYRELMADEDEVEFFLNNICTSEWNELQDAGRSLEEATAVLCAHFPEYEPQIRAYYGSWQKMLKGYFPDTVNLLKSLADQDYRLLALTNWSDETFHVAREKYEFLGWFEGILVSGKEKMKKPDPAIFNLLTRRYNLIPNETLFIDDNQHNVSVASRLGFDTIHFKGTDELHQQMTSRGILLTPIIQ